MSVVISKRLRDLTKASKQYAPVILGLFVVVALIGAITWALWPKTVLVQVDNIEWRYVVKLKEKKIVHSSGWGSPWNGEVVNGSMSCVSKFYGMKECFCHTDYSYSGFGKNRMRHSRTTCSSCPDYRN